MSMAGLLPDLSCFFFAAPSHALEAIPLTSDKDMSLICPDVVFFTKERGDRLQVETAPGTDGIVGRMAVRAQKSGSNPRWVVFALTNKGNVPVDRWLIAERYSLRGSQLFRSRSR